MITTDFLSIISLSISFIGAVVSIVTLWGLYMHKDRDYRNKRDEFLKMKENVKNRISKGRENGL